MKQMSKDRIWEDPTSSKEKDWVLDTGRKKNRLTMTS